MLTTPADIRDRALLGLLGDILQPEIAPAAIGALRLRLMQSGFSWQALVDLAREQGVLLPLTYALSERTLLPPVPRSIANTANHVGVRLTEAYAQHLSWREADRRQLEDILRILGGIGTMPLLLKGARYLIAPLGPWCAARSMGDLDILVRSDDAARAFAALKAEGYREMMEDGAAYGPAYAYHLPPLVHADHALPVEIHVDALAAAGRRIMSTEQVWSRATRHDGAPFFALPSRWHALHGLLHHQIQDRGHLQRVLSIKALWEWTMLAQAFTESDWEAIRTHMRTAHALDVLDSWQLQAQRLFGLETPGDWEASAAARAHADATFRKAFRPYWLRRTGYVADQIRASFARETLASKYDVPLSRVSLLHAGRNLMDLLRRHHGNLLQRLTGLQDQLW